MILSLFETSVDSPSQSTLTVVIIWDIQWTHPASPLRLLLLSKTSSGLIQPSHFDCCHYLRHPVDSPSHPIQPAHFDCCHYLRHQVDSPSQSHFNVALWSYRDTSNDGPCYKWLSMFTHYRSGFVTSIVYVVDSISNNKNCKQKVANYDSIPLNGTYSNRLPKSRL